MDKTTSQLEKLIKKAAKKYEGMPIALSGGIDSGLLAALIKPKFAIHVKIPDEKLGEHELAMVTARHLKIPLHIVELDTSKFKQTCEKAFKAIGKPIPHFNIFPLYEMYRVLKEEYGVKELVLADGPDESMCGYTRHLIMNYLYGVYNYEAFWPYRETINKIWPWVAPEVRYADDVARVDFVKAVSLLKKEDSLISVMCRIDMALKRPEMDSMSNGLAKNFGIKNLRPYQDNREIDEFMFNLPIELKIHNVEYGKYALRLIAEKYLPHEIAWRKIKVGGPVFPVNKFMGWDKTEGDYGKRKWLAWQKKVLK